MLRDVLVVIHASAGFAGLITGLAAIPPRLDTHRFRPLRLGYPGCVGVLLASLVVLLVTDWQTLETGARIAFGGLAVLGGVMATRGVLAMRESSRQSPGWQGRYIAHVYFTYIALWVGFLVLPALKLPYPQVSAPIAVGATLVVGHVLVTRYRRRYASLNAERSA